jgi:hypothetical protein
VNAPDPYEVRSRVVVAGKQYVISDRAPHLDSWRYTGVPVDLSGAQTHFDHEEALPVRPLAPSGRGVLASAGLDPEQFDREVAEVAEFEVPGSPLEELLAAVALEFHRGNVPDSIHGAWITYAETR